jgi:hypothetical protein
MAKSTCRCGALLLWKSVEPQSDEWMLVAMPDVPESIGGLMAISATGAFCPGCGRLWIGWDDSSNRLAEYVPADPATRAKRPPLHNPDRSSGKVNLGWMNTVSLRPFLETMARLVDYKFDPDDWGAFEAGLPGTDSEHGPWFDYPIGSAHVEVAYESRADEMVTVVVDRVPGAIYDQVCWTAELMREYFVRDQE